MKTSHPSRFRNLGPGLLAAAIITAFTPVMVHPLYAHEEAQHDASKGGSDHGGHHHVAVPKSTGQAWVAIQEGVSKIESALSAHDLKPIHEAEESISASLKWLQENTHEITGDKSKRLEAALKQAVTLAGNLHMASDAGDQAKSEAEFKKLRGALKLVEAQYPAEALKAPASTERGDHSHATAGEATTIVTVTTSAPLEVGKKADVIVKLSKKDGSPVLLTDLEDAHTEKIHLLIIDGSLTDYHHEHPEATSVPGEYAFTFTPRKPGPYRVWADLIPTTTGVQEYAIADIASPTKGDPVGDRDIKTTVEVDGLKCEVTFDKPELKVGEAVLGKLKILKADGKVFDQLEPLMGAYAHIVGFGEDYKSIAHVHPMGKEPTQATDRGIGELEFHLLPSQPGLMRLFAQVQIGGRSLFMPYTLEVKASVRAQTDPQVDLPTGQVSGPLKEVLDQYINVQIALASDSLSGVPEAAAALAETAKKDKSGIFSLAVAEQAEKLAKTTDIEAARSAFRPLSRSLIEVLDKQGLKTGYFVASCPMAKASWIQAEKSIKNPYYGKSMLKCGTLKP